MQSPSTGACAAVCVPVSAVVFDRCPCFSGIVARWKRRGGARVQVAESSLGASMDSTPRWLPGAGTGTSSSTVFRDFRSSSGGLRSNSKDSSYLSALDFNPCSTPLREQDEFPSSSGQEESSPLLPDAEAEQQHGIAWRFLGPVFERLWGGHSNEGDDRASTPARSAGSFVSDDDGAEDGTGTPRHGPRLADEEDQHGKPKQVQVSNGDSPQSGTSPPALALLRALRFSGFQDGFFTSAVRGELLNTCRGGSVEWDESERRNPSGTTYGRGAPRQNNLKILKRFIRDQIASGGVQRLVQAYWRARCEEVPDFARNARLYYAEQGVPGLLVPDEEHYNYFDDLLDENSTSSTAWSRAAVLPRSSSFCFSLSADTAAVFLLEFFFGFMNGVDAASMRYLQFCDWSSTRALELIARTVVHRNLELFPGVFGRGRVVPWEVGADEDLVLKRRTEESEKRFPSLMRRALQLIPLSLRVSRTLLNLNTPADRFFTLGLMPVYGAIQPGSDAVLLRALQSYGEAGEDVGYAAVEDLGTLVYVDVAHMVRAFPHFLEAFPADVADKIDRRFLNPAVGGAYLALLSRKEELLKQAGLDGLTVVADFHGVNTKLIGINLLNVVRRLLAISAACGAKAGFVGGIRRVLLWRMPKVARLGWKLISWGQSRDMQRRMIILEDGGASRKRGREEGNDENSIETSREDFKSHSEFMAALRSVGVGTTEFFGGEEVAVALGRLRESAKSRELPTPGGVRRGHRS